MRVPVSWLRDFTPIDLPTNELVDVCNSLGLVVEGVEQIGGGFDGVVVGHVLDVRPHPNADRVRLSTVDIGTGEPQQIACGAANLAVGQHVPVATLGTTLPGGMTIERRKLRGEWSNGMICSEDELGMAPDRAEGIMVLPEETEIGKPFAEVMGIEQDVVLDLEIETNRPDAMCIAGIARDIAATLGLPFHIPDPMVEENGPRVGDLASLRIERPDLCPRFTLRVLQDVRVGPSPDFIARRLTLAGMRPINNVVDASNYVMLELGLPSHPYDRSRVARSQLGVRGARAGETIVTLDDQTRPVPQGACAIIDGNDAIIGLAGVMGGASSDITESTSEVLIEIAQFDPYSINYTSRVLALRTDASARFERRIDRDGHLRAQNRLVELLRLSSPDLRCAEGTLDEQADEPWPSSREQLTVRTTRVNEILGTTFSPEAICDYLEPMGFVTSIHTEGEIAVTVPSFRPDCEREIDVIEEIARMHGYERIARRVPTSPFAARLTPHQQLRRRVRHRLVGQGFTEAWTTSLLGPDDVEKVGITDPVIELANPVTREESLLRNTMLPGMLRAVSYNTARQQLDLSFFEVGRVFFPPETERVVGDGGTAPRAYPYTEVGAIDLHGDHAGTRPSDEFEHLAMCQTGGDVDAQSIVRSWRELTEGLRLVRRLDLVPVSRPGFHPSRCAEVRDGAVALGVIGEVDPAVCAAFHINQRVAYLEVDLRVLLAHVDVVPQMSPITKYPSAEFDLAFLVPNAVRADEVEATLRDALKTNLEEVTLFDVYRDERSSSEVRSLAYRLKVSSLAGTLSDAEMAEIRTRAIEAVTTAHGASLRG